jgi:hypothetical protein
MSIAFRGDSKGDILLIYLLQNERPPRTMFLYKNIIGFKIKEFL